MFLCPCVQCFPVSVCAVFSCVGVCGIFLCPCVRYFPVGVCSVFLCRCVQCFPVSVCAVFSCVRVCSIFLCRCVWLPVPGILTCARILMHAIAHGGCTDYVRGSALEVDPGRIIPCRTLDSNPCQYCAWLFSRTLYQLIYPPSPPHVSGVVHCGVCRNGRKHQ